MKIFLKLSLISTLIIFTGCGAKYSNMNSGDSVYQESIRYSNSSPSPQIAYSPIKRIITKRADISVDVDSIDGAKASLQSIIEKSGGHITNATHRENRYNASAKIPSTKLMDTLNEIGKLGEKTSLSISQNDVTNQFVDNEARLKNLVLFRDKMKNLLSRTTSIEEILKIERELRRVQTEIDSIQGRLKYLKDAVALSPVSINLKEKTIYGPLGYIGNSIWWITKKLFVIK